MPQWLLWRHIDGRKVPVNALTLQVCDPHRADNQTTYDVASEMARQTGYGLAFVFTGSDPYFFIDIDHAWDGTKWSDIAVTLMSQFPGAMVEVSQSMTGLHIIGSAPSPGPHRKKNTALGIELYTEKRFVALTGISESGDPDTDHSAALAGVISAHFAETEAAPQHDGPDPEWAGPTDDEELIRKALATQSAGSAFAGSATFRDLWEGNIEALARSYPDHNRDYDASSADAALAHHLAFWTGRDEDRMIRLMKQSALVRDKWERDDYLPRTVAASCRNQTTVYTGRRKTETASPTTPGGPDRKYGSQYMTADLQVSHFRGCVYVQDIHRIFTPDGSLLKPDQFRSMYGGYTFAMDTTGDRSSRNAWEAFTESQAIRHPKVVSTIFKPDRPTGDIVHRNGRTYVNTYVPIDVPSQVGDPTPFLTHLHKVLPDPGDSGILLAYMAAVVQHKGVKFQWAPLLQGVEGNGKTLFTRCIASAVGSHYVHYPKAADLDNKFNGWLLNKIFIGIEDVYVPANRLEILEILKPMITAGDGLEIQLKGVDQITVDICANFMLNSNHKDAIRKTGNDRRFAVFFTAQQHADDLKRDGMDGDYFPDLYQWLNTGGYAIVTHYLQHYDIPDHLNPATSCHRAPVTSSTVEAIQASLGGVEQEVLDCIEAGIPGFCGGWISSLELDRVLKTTAYGSRIPHTKRRDFLKAMGYEWHKALSNGRSHSRIETEGGRPKLYIHKDNPDAHLTRPDDVIRAYREAQGYEQSI